MTDELRERDTGVSAGRFEELTARLREQLSSRREFLADSAKVGGGALALSAAGGGVAAAKDDEKDGDDGSDGERQGNASTVDVLNYALTLEKLEATFYERGLATYNPSDFEQAEFAQACENPPDKSIHARLVDVRDHEQAHVDTISATINDLGGQPVSGLEFEFSHENPTEFVELGAVLEATGVSAYNGAINLLDSEELLTAAATIATVEGRHSAYLNDLTGSSPFPRAFDPARPMAEIKEKIAPFIVSQGDGSGNGSD